MSDEGQPYVSWKDADGDTGFFIAGDYMRDYQDVTDENAVGLFEVGPEGHPLHAVYIDKRIARQIVHRLMPLINDGES